MKKSANYYSFLFALSKISYRPFLSALIITLWLLPLIVLLVVGGKTNLIIAAVIVVMLIVFVVYLFIADSYFKKGRANLPLNTSTGLVRVKNRIPLNRIVLISEKYYEVYNQYNPASATFTAVSVGGVTTGGWDVKEAHYSVGKINKTDKWVIAYRTKDNKNPFVAEFKLNQADLKVAKSNNFLKEFVVDSADNGANFILLHRIKNAKNAYALYNQDRDMYAMNNAMQKDYTKMMLTKDEVERVLEFLCGENKGEYPEAKKAVPSTKSEEQKAVSLKNYVCESCGRHYKEMHDECPRCHAVGKIKKLNE